PVQPCLMPGLAELLENRPDVVQLLRARRIFFHGHLRVSQVRVDDNPTSMTSPEPRTSRHLSLLEVAVVLIVIAALSLFAIPQVQSRRILVHEGRARELLRQIHDAEQQFFLANDGKTYGFLPEILGGEVAGRSEVQVKPRVLAASGLTSLGFAHLKDGY